MMNLVVEFFNSTNEALSKGAEVNKLIGMKVRERIGRFKYTPAENIENEYDVIINELHKEIDSVLKQKGDF